MKTKYLSKLFILLIFLSFTGISVVHADAYIQPGANNTTIARGACVYELKGNLWPLFFWTILNPAVVYNSAWNPCAECTTSEFLRVKWKNVKANAYPSSLTAYYGSTSTWIDLPAFTLTMPTLTFTVGTSLNIPCHITSSTTISLNPYINTGTASVNIDENEVITDDFEWTLPLGWSTTTGQTGTFVGTSSINVLPPATASATSISVKAKANMQYSSPITLQITRNLEDFTINGPATVVCYESNRFTASVTSSGVTYSWQLPTGWTGVSNSNYIDVIAKGSTGSIVCTITGCNQSKVSPSKTVTVNKVPVGTIISGPPSVCSYGVLFTINGLNPLCSVLWTCGPNLTIFSGQNTSSCTFKSSGNGSSWVQAKVITDCGDIDLPLINVWSGLSIINPNISLAYFDGSSYNNICNSQNYTINMNIQPSNSSVVWSRIAANPSNTSWYQSGNDITFYFYALNQTAVYRISASNDCGCTTNDFGFKSIDCGGGCDAAYELSPNPSSSMIKIVPQIPPPCFAATTSALNKSGSITVFDQQGSLKKKIKYFYNSEAEIDVSDLKNGTYIVQINDGNSMVKKSIIVNH